MRIYFSHNDLLVWTSGMFLILFTPLIRGAHSLASVELTHARGSFDKSQASRAQTSSKSLLFHIVPRQYVTCEWAGTCNFKASTPVQLHSLILLRKILSEFALAFHHIYINKEHTDELSILSTYF